MHLQPRTSWQNLTRKLQKKRKKRPRISHTQTLAQKDEERELFGAVSDSVELSSEEEDSDEEDDIEPRAQILVLVFHFQNQMILKKWSPTPKPVSEPEQRCEQEKLELKISSGLKKEYAHMRTVQTAGPATSLAASERQELVTLTQKWPDRAKTPSVRDIVAFWPHISPEKVSELAGAQFRWNQEKTISMCKE